MGLSRSPARSCSKTCSGVHHLSLVQHEVEQRSRVAPRGTQAAPGALVEILFTTLRPCLVLNLRAQNSKSFHRLSHARTFVAVLPWANASRTKRPSEQSFEEFPDDVRERRTSVHKVCFDEHRKWMEGGCWWPTGHPELRPNIVGAGFWCSSLICSLSCGVGQEADTAPPPPHISCVPPDWRARHPGASRFSLRSELMRRN